MSFMHRHGFNIKHITRLMQFEHSFFWLSWWGCFLIFCLKQNCWREGDRKKDTSVWHPHSLLSIKKSLDNNHPSLNWNLLSHWFKKQTNPVTRRKKKRKKKNLLQTAGKWFNGLMQAFLQTTTSSFLLPNKRFQHLNMMLEWWVISCKNDLSLLIYKILWSVGHTTLHTRLTE